jgi:hypothetical protein
MRIIFLLLLFVFCHTLMAQQVVATAGGTLDNLNGSMSFTIGEGVANTLTKGDKTLTQGFQQGSVSVIEIKKPTDSDITIIVFPNPVSDKLTLRIDKEDVSGFQYLIFDINGKLVSQKNLLSNETEVPVNNLSKGTYFLKVQTGVKELRTFKIIKQ